MLSSYWSMPQGASKSGSELVEFQVMLPNINLLYLFCDVLILLDLSYLSRFWYRIPKHSLPKIFALLTALALIIAGLSSRRS